jgi:hypothetical protein
MPINSSSDKFGLQPEINNCKEISTLADVMERRVM